MGTRRSFDDYPPVMDTDADADLYELPPTLRPAEADHTTTSGAGRRLSARIGG